MAFTHTINEGSVIQSQLVNLQKTFYQWMNDYERMLRHMIVGFEAVPALQDELYQDIALNIWKALPNFQQKSSPKTFVARIAQNILASHVAKAVKTVKATPIEDSTVEPAEAKTPYSELDAAQRQARLTAAIRALGFEQQQVITLALEGLSYAEMAEILDITSNLVGVRLKRAKTSLTELLEV